MHKVVRDSEAVRYPISMKDLDCGHRITDAYADALTTRQEYQEILAAAFLKLTKLPPDEVELVEVPFQGGIRWYFRKRVVKKGK